MGNIIDASKDVTKAGAKALINPFDKGNLKDLRDKNRKHVKELQKAMPESKYLGASMFPGVDSEKKRKEKVKAQHKTDAATAAQEARDRSSMPSQAEIELTERRKSARTKSRGGRMSTILSDETLG